MLKEFLHQVTVADYKLFKQQVIERCRWKEQQYQDRMNGRVKLTALEKEIVSQVVAELPSNKQSK